MCFHRCKSLSADSFDWRSVNGLNWNTVIKSQFGGTCWDFSSCGTIEAHYMLTRDDIHFQPDLSEQQNCWETNPDLGSTGGGWGTAVLDYARTHGIVSEAECPHQPSSEDVGIAPYWPLASGWANRVWKITSNSNGVITYNPSNPSASVNAMKNYLKTTGPMLVGIWAGHDLYGSVQDIIDNYRAPDASGYDHQVSLVGYCDDARIPTGGYWIIKNSWGYSNNNPDDYSGSGYNVIPYGNIEVHNDMSIINGPAYFTGAMVAATWKGGSGTWSAGGNNWTGTDITATRSRPTPGKTRKPPPRSTPPAERALRLSGKVITHGITINSGATGYVFNGGNILR